MHGLLIIDKPAGITSHDVVRRIRRKTGIRRVGHGGTLDPMATGVIPVAIGEATRLLEYFSESDKGYAATMRLGSITDSQDAEGEIVATGEWQGLSCSEVNQAIIRMNGPIEQIPPMYSALKRNGTPLYKLARQGLAVEREPRPVVIRSINMTACELPEVSFDVVCSKGTYVRTLAHDIGQDLGCGAHLSGLRRFRHGAFEIAAAVNLERFEASEDVEQYIVPLIDMLPDRPLVPVGEEAAGRLCNGIPPAAVEADLPPGIVDGTMVRITAGKKLLAVAHYAPGREREKRGDFELAKVFVRTD
ncbi:MAG: tRNA pseudouridine(55) synthase TruB [Desulfuromonas sp.]|nr:MAG: tRNA pseudouridine(55) synthase TruB [Desulfuromonas sp.]